MSLRSTATALALGRIGLGAVLLIAIRDVAIGVGGAAALLSGSDSARAWMLAAAAADLGDLVATLLARDVIPANGVAAVGVLAGGSAAVCAATAASLD